MKIEDLKIGDTLVGKVSGKEFKITRLLCGVFDFFGSVESFVEFENGVRLDKDSLQGYELKEESKKVKGFEVGSYDNLLCWMWDDGNDPYLSLLQSVDEHSEFPFSDYEDISWQNCRPLTQEERKFLEVDSKPIK